MSEKSEDCWQCRLTSGGGLMAAGAYVIYHSKKLKFFSNHIVAAIGYGLGAVGLLRISALPPFTRKSIGEPNRLTEDGEESEYIVGKFPSKPN